MCGRHACHVMSCHVMSCHVMSCHVMSCHVMSCHVMSCHVMSCHVMSCHVMSCHVMSCHVMSYICISEQLTRSLDNISIYAKTMEKVFLRDLDVKTKVLKKARGLPNRSLYKTEI